MSNPAITYNGKTVTFPAKHYRQQIDPPHAVLSNRSASGLGEDLNVNVSEVINIGARNFVNANSTDAIFKRNIEQWFEWAQRRLSWKFALDASETVLTTLASGAAAGASSLVLASATGVVAGKQYVLRNKTARQKVNIVSIAGAPTVTITETLDFAFSAGDRFRSEMYWPGRLIDSSNPLVEMPQVMFDLSLKFIEDMN